MAEAAENKKSASAGSVLGTLIVAGFGVWYWLGGGLEKHAAHNMEQIEDQVAADSEKQYGIAKRSGSAMDACVHAGMVAAAHLQAKNEAAFAQWTATEKADCAAAGMPQ